MADCTVSGCPDPRNEAEWHLRPCLHIGGVEHAEGGHHHHWPKKSQGGTEIVGFPCAFCHDRIDNGSWGNKVENINGERHWLVWDLHGVTLIDRVLDGSGTPEVIGETDGTHTQVEEASIQSRSSSTSTMGEDLPRVRLPAEPSHPLKADWSGLTDDELSTEFQQADTLQQVGFLRKCKAVNAYRDKQPHGVNWVEPAYDLFHVSRRTLEAYSNIYELYVSSDASIADNIGPLTDSASLMRFIGLKSIEDGRAALEEAVVYLAKYGEPPTVADLTHVEAKCPSDLSPDGKHTWTPCECERKCQHCGEAR